MGGVDLNWIRDLITSTNRDQEGKKAGISGMNLGGNMQANMKSGIREYSINRYDGFN